LKQTRINENEIKAPSINPFTINELIVLVLSNLLNFRDCYSIVIITYDLAVLVEDILNACPKESSPKEPEGSRLHAGVSKAEGAG